MNSYTLIIVITGLLGFSTAWNLLETPLRKWCFDFYRQGKKYFQKLYQRQKIRDQWSDGIQLLSGALRAGLSLEQALDIMREESPAPLRDHLRDQWSKGGEWLPLAKRIEILFDDEELGLTKSTLKLSFEMGGRLTQLLETQARLLRRKKEMQLKVKTLTAQGRLSAWIVGLTPFVLLGLLFTLSPDFVRPLFDLKQGRILLVFICFLVVSGLILVHRVIRMDP